jgi:phosphopantothenoylcysteine synthetase/decarboxylase
MSPENFDVAYLVLSGTTTAARCPELLRGLVELGFSTVIAIPTPNAARVIAARELADIEGVQVVQSYFDLAIRPRPPRGVVMFAPCSFNSLNKLAHGIADNLALSVVAEAIGRGTPVIVGPSLNAPLLEHPPSASITEETARLGCDNRAAGRRGRGTAPRLDRGAN